LGGLGEVAEALVRGLECAGGVGRRGRGVAQTGAGVVERGVAGAWVVGEGETVGQVAAQLMQGLRQAGSQVGQAAVRVGRSLTCRVVIAGRVR
jgi:hypothetical protein